MTALFWQTKYIVSWISDVNPIRRRIAAHKSGIWVLSPLLLVSVQHRDHLLTKLGGKTRCSPTPASCKISPIRWLATGYPPASRLGFVS